MLGQRSRRWPNIEPELRHRPGGITYRQLDIKETYLQLHQWSVTIM